MWTITFVQQKKLSPTNKTLYKFLIASHLTGQHKKRKFLKLLWVIHFVPWYTHFFNYLNCFVVKLKVNVTPKRKLQKKSNINHLHFYYICYVIPFYFYLSYTKLAKLEMHVKGNSFMFSLNKESCREFCDKLTTVLKLDYFYSFLTKRDYKVQHVLKTASLCQSALF